MKLLLQILIPVVILVGSVFAAKKIVESRPEARTRPSFDAVQSVDATKLTRSDYQVTILSQGTVRPGRETSLVPEITGIVRNLSPKFVIGEAFTAGDILVKIDGRDYEIAVAQANARYAQASATLQEEKARSVQSIADWKSLGRKGKPSALTARTPQLAAARANLSAAKAEIQKAQLDLERTSIVAPYDGRVLEKRVDEGEFVSRGVNLGRIYSVDTAEIRLPLSNRQLTYLELPGGGSAPEVTLKARVGGVDAVWSGNIVRSEGIDATSQQLSVIAQLKEPFEPTADRPAIQTGQFVTAEIKGKVLKDVFVVPRSALREDREVLLVDEESNLKKVKVSVAWTDEDVAAISEGLKEGDILTLTTLGAVTSGTKVRATVDGVAPPRGQGQSGAGLGKLNKNRRSDAAKTTKSGETGGQAQNSDNRQARMQKLKAMVDAGEDIPEETKTRLRKRLEAGAPLPPWLVEAIK